MRLKTFWNKYCRRPGRILWGTLKTGHSCLDNQITSYYCQCNLKSYLDSLVLGVYIKVV